MPLLKRSDGWILLRRGSLKCTPTAFSVPRVTVPVPLQDKIPGTSDLLPSPNSTASTLTHERLNKTTQYSNEQTYQMAGGPVKCMGTATWCAPNALPPEPQSQKPWQHCTEREKKLIKLEFVQKIGYRTRLRICVELDGDLKFKLSSAFPRLRYSLLRSKTSVSTLLSMSFKRRRFARHDFPEPFIPVIRLMPSLSMGISKSARSSER